MPAAPQHPGSIEEQLAEANWRMQLMAEHSAIVVWALDREGRFTTALGRATGAAGGDRRGNVLGARVEDVLADYPELLENHRRALRGETFTATSKWEGRTYTARYAPTRDKYGEITGIVCVATDVTELRRFEEELRNTEQLNRRIVDLVPSGIFLVSPSGEFLRFNAAAQRFLGKSKEELANGRVENYERITIGEDGAPFPIENFPVIRCLRTREAQPAVTVGVYQPSGELRWGVFSAAPVNDPTTGAFVGALVTLSDVTELRRAEEDKRKLEVQLAQAQKLEALGRLAGGVAHDFNNLLTGILGHASVLKEMTEPGSEAHVSCQIIERAAERASALTQQLLGFARRGKHQDVPFDLKWVTSEAVSFLGRAFDKKHELVLSLCDAPCVVSGDPSQLQQVILNLALNARDAMPKGGEIHISVGPATVTEDEASAEPEARAGDYIVLAVKDAGVGISPEVRSHIFEPFFTTKERGKGTGMGLAMVYGIVRNHSGWVSVDSAAGVGTTMRVFLPAQDLVVPTEPEESSGTTRAAGARILIVDDEEVVRNTAAALLRSAHHRVDVAAGGEQAVAIHSAGRGGFDLVLLDLSMPKMDGPTCFRELKRIDPNVRVLITTGYDPGDALKDLLAEGVCGFVLKPYRRKDLLDAVERCLAARPSTRWA